MRERSETKGGRWDKARVEGGRTAGLGLWEEVPGSMSVEYFQGSDLGK